MSDDADVLSRTNDDFAAFTALRLSAAEPSQAGPGPELCN
jgi:hypothetical protein